MGEHRGSSLMEQERRASGVQAREARGPAARTVRRQLARVLESPDFDASRRSREFLSFIVEETLGGRADALTQAAIATAVFGRRDDFDPTVDPIVRIQAGRLRRSLERYYLLSGHEDGLRIELPKGSYVPAFRVFTPGAVAPDGGDGEATAGEPGDGWPTLVQSAFEVVGSGPEVEALAARMSEELGLELGRYGTVRVWHDDGDGPPPPGRARFALSGRVDVAGGGLRVTARLVDRAAGHVVWGDEYRTAPQPGRWSGSAEDAARVVAARVAAEEGVVVQHLAVESRKRRSAEATVYDAYLLSSEFFLARDPALLGPALEALRRVVASQPEFSLAWTRLARLCLANLAFEVTEIPTPLDETIALAQHGVRLDPASRSARCVLASAFLVKGELAAGREEVEQALASSPGSLVYLDVIGYLLTLFGDWERGRAISQEALARNPHCLPHVRFGLWAGHLHRGELEPAHQAALEYRDPTFFMRAAMRASCLGLLGRTAEGRAEVAELLARNPRFAARGRTLLGHYIKFPELLDRVVEGLARSGLTLA
jgi:adenylate cyclase